MLCMRIYCIFVFVKKQRMRLFPTLALLAISATAFAQQDTVVQYYNKDWKITTRDSAEYISKVVKTGDKQWRRQDFWIKTNIMQMDGYYEDAATSINDGYVNYYYPSGVLKDSCLYVHDKQRAKYMYYENKVHKAYATFDNNYTVIEQAGWNEDGTSIPDYIYQKIAEFPGGSEKWIAYLVKNMQRNQPSAYQKGKISGVVIITFSIDKEGNVTDVAVDKSSGYGDLDRHAVSVVSKSPKWIPAIQYNKHVIFKQRQQITYPPVN